MSSDNKTDNHNNKPRNEQRFRIFAIALSLVAIVLLCISIYYNFVRKPDILSKTMQINETVLYSDITFAIDNISVDSNSNVIIEGWAFIPDTDTKETEIYLVMTVDDEKKYYATSARVDRDDVASFYKNIAKKYSGFRFVFNETNLATGIYEMGIAIKHEGISYEKTYRIIEFNGNQLSYYEDKAKDIRLTKMPEPEGVTDDSSAIQFNIEDVSWYDETTLVIKGWAFYTGANVRAIEPILVVQATGGECQYYFIQDRYKRLDVRDVFGDIADNIEYSGFFALINANEIPDGEHMYGIAFNIDDQYVRKMQSG